MGYSGVIADCFNTTETVLVAACTAGSIGVAQQLVVPAGPGPVEYPNLVVSVPTTPYERAKWSGIQNLKDSQLTFEIWVNTQLDASQATAGGTPYGSGTIPGLFVLAAEVENALEAAYTTLKASNAAVVDVQVLDTSYQRSGNNVSAIVHLNFWIRYFAGQR